MTAGAYQSCAASFSFEDERCRFDVLVESVRRVGKAPLGVGAIVKLHRDVQHYEIRSGYTSARPRFEQRARRSV